MTTHGEITTIPPELLELATVLLNLLLPDNASPEDYENSLAEFLQKLLLDGIISLGKYKY